MSLSNLADWNQAKSSPEKGSACGAEKPAKPDKKPAACGSACGASKK